MVERIEREEDRVWGVIELIFIFIFIRNKVAEKEQTKYDEGKRVKANWVINFKEKTRIELEGTKRDWEGKKGWLNQIFN